MFITAGSKETLISSCAPYALHFIPHSELISISLETLDYIEESGIMALFLDETG
jgi:hypothetical protein